MAETEVMVRGKGIELSFGSTQEGNFVEVLRGIDMTIHKGESIGLVGASGSGKTSLMMVLGGLEKATKGRVVIDDEDITALDEEKLTQFRREKLGIVFQHFHLMGNMTALENVVLPLGIRGIADAKEKAEEALSLVGLGHRMLHYPKQMSGGEQQRVAIARAFVGNPKLIFADEPTGNLDVATGHMVRDMIFEQADRNGTAVLLITHDMELVKSCSRCVWMSDGLLENSANS